MTDRIALGLAGALFVGSIICAAILLPDRIEMYYTPTDRADVVYARWQYLILIPTVTLVLTVAAASMSLAVMALVNTFILGDMGNTRRVGYRVATWTLLWSAGVIWLTIWLGNAAEHRSWSELLAGVVGLLGGVLIIGSHTWAGVRQRTAADPTGSSPASGWPGRVP